MRTAKTAEKRTFTEELALGAFRMPYGQFEGLTLEEILRRPGGLRALRFISRGTMPSPVADAIRAFLATTNPLALRGEGDSSHNLFA